MNLAQIITDFFTEWTGNDYLTLYLISIIPVIELRGALVIMAGMPSIDTVTEMIAGMFCCVAGSTTVILPLILLTRPLLRKLKNTKMLSKFAKNMENNLASRAEEAYKEEQGADNGKKKWHKPLSQDAKKSLGLFVFVAIPLPMTGAWTGSCIGSFLDFPVWKASLSVFAGNIVAAAILTTIAYFLPNQYADIFLYGFVVLAIALAVVLYFTRAKKQERKTANERAKYSTDAEYELALLKKEADQDGKMLIKKEYIDENGDKHIVIGVDEKRNSNAVGNDDLI